jgi:hypothetical protein
LVDWILHLDFMMRFSWPHQEWSDLAPSPASVG